MSSDRDFQERAWLQRRQVYHVDLLESQRFNPSFVGARNRAGPLSRSEGSASELLGVMAGSLLLLFFFYSIPALIFSAVVGLPAALMLWLILRIGTGYWTEFSACYRATVIGSFCYLTTTVLMALGATVLDAHGLPEPFNLILAGIPGLSARTLENLTSMTLGVQTPATLMTTVFAEVRAHFGAFLALHGAGVLAYAIALSKWVGSPLDGFKGFVWAIAWTVVMVPLVVISVLMVILGLLS